MKLQEGNAIAGTVLEETADTLKLRAADGSESVLPKSEIAAQTPPISVMPPMLGILTKREIRDVVAYLMSLTKLPKKEEEH